MGGLQFHAAIDPTEITNVVKTKAKFKYNKKVTHYMPHNNYTWRYLSFSGLSWIGLDRREDNPGSISKCLKYVQYRAYFNPFNDKSIGN